jgi:3-deoxy-D-manno-octulosonic-acid transferase
MTWSIWILMLAFLGVAVLSAFLIKHRMSEDSIATWAQITTIIGGVAAAVSLLWAAHTITPVPVCKENFLLKRLIKST